MTKHIVLTFLLLSAMSSCITVSIVTETPAAPPLVTSTLPPTSTVPYRLPFTPSPVLVTVAVSERKSVQCKQGAVLLADVTIPDNSTVPAGKIFTKIWRFKNTGTCPWTGFTIHYESGERMNAPASAYAASASTSTSAISIGDIHICCKFNYSENAGYVRELTSLINQARENAGLSALDPNPLLTQAAQGHSIDMACNNFLGHEGSDGSRFGALVQAAGFPTSFQEIIAIGTPQNAMDQWAADTGHWEILLNALATEMGIGYAYNGNSDFGGYFTVDIH